MNRRIEHRRARDTAAWIGQRITVDLPGEGVLSGVLSDVDHNPKEGATLLFVAGRRVVVRDGWKVTLDSLGLLGGETT